MTDFVIFYQVRRGLHITRRRRKKDSTAQSRYGFHTVHRQMLSFGKRNIKKKIDKGRLQKEDIKYDFGVA